MYLKNLFFIFLVLTVTFQICLSQEKTIRQWDNGVGHSRWLNTALDKDKKKIENLWEEIGVSLKTTSNPYAGTYFQYGDMMGDFLRWSPEKGFVFVKYYDQSLIYYFSYGKVSITNSEIIFNAEKEVVIFNQGNPFTPKIWIPVGQGNFLVKKNEVESFGNFYGGFKEFNGYPRNWYCECFPFAKRQETISHKSLPLAPNEYQKFIRQPISGEITSIGKRKVVNESDLIVNQKASHTTATINIGRNKGVSKGMMFFLLNQGDKFDQILKVVKVGRKSSQAVIARSINEKGIEAFYDVWDKTSGETIYTAFPQLRIGIKITTSPVLADF